MHQTRGGSKGNVYVSATSSPNHPISQEKVIPPPKKGGYDSPNDPPAQAHISAAQAKQAIALSRAEHTNPSENDNSGQGHVTAAQAQQGIALSRAIHTNPSENDSNGGPKQISEATAKGAIEAYRAQHTNPGQHSSSGQASESSAADTHYPAGLGHADMATHSVHLDAAVTHNVAGTLHDASHHDAGHHAG